MDSGAANRIAFHNMLLTLGTTHVYFQPPETIKMVYPCIVYTRSQIQNTFANNGTYLQNVNYEVTVIDKTPDSSLVVNVSKFKNAKHTRHFTSDGLHHDVFQIYY